MEIVYGSNKLSKQFSDATQMKRAFGTRAKKVSERKDDILSAPHLGVLMQLPYANCHPLTANRKGDWALDISANFRIIFEIAHEPIPMSEDGEILVNDVNSVRITGVEDYH